MKKKILHSLSIFLPLLILPISSLSLRAQTFSIDWFTIDGGGGTSTGGVFSVSGTIGQPDTGRMSGGNYTLVGGYWAVVAAVQTPEAPWLTINRTNGLITVSWPLPASGFILQETPSLDLTTVSWMGVSPSLYQTNTTDIYLEITMPQGNRFYRLEKP